MFLLFFLAFFRNFESFLVCIFSELSFFFSHLIILLFLFFVFFSGKIRKQNEKNYMSVNRLHQVTDYWSWKHRNIRIASTMRRDRFWAILSCIHFANNKADRVPGDPLWKIRTWMDSVIENFQKWVEKEQVNAVDEMMVPYKARIYFYHYFFHRFFYSFVTFTATNFLFSGRISVSLIINCILFLFLGAPQS